MAAGILLVMLSWAFALALVIALGSPWALLTARRSGTQGRRGWGWVRGSLWWGLGIATLAVEALGLVAPLRSVHAGLAILTVAAVSAMVAGIMWRRRSSASRGVGARTSRMPAVGWALVCAATLVTISLAGAALGPVTNYDSGLYHLGAIAYAGDYATIPGLANLYFPFGYGTSTFPLAAILGNGPWAGQGFRLLNGLIIVMAMLDLVIRFRRRTTTAGSMVLLVGLWVALVPLLWMSDYWVTSPTSDTGVLVLTVVCSAALTDAVYAGRSWSSHAAVAVVVALVLVTMRPLMAVYVLVVLSVVVVLAVRRGMSSPTRLLLPLGGFGVLVAVVQCVRDVRLSGWIQYPLSLAPVDVPWRAVDPVVNRTATLGAARDPENLWNAAVGWEWIGPWVNRLPTQWEVGMLAVLLLGAVVVGLTAHRLRASVGWRRSCLLMAPAAVTVIVWFLASPPSFRFVWGPLFTLGSIPIGLGLHAISRSGPMRWQRATVLVTWGLAVGLAVLASASLVVRVLPQARNEEIGWAVGALHVDLPASMPPVAKTHLLTLDGGLTVRAPADSDQCWAVYPLCTPLVEMSVIQLGPDLGDGFANDVSPSRALSSRTLSSRTLSSTAS